MEEETTVEQTTESSDSTALNEAMAEIKKLKETTVSKEKYEKAQEEIHQLVRNLTEQRPQTTEPEETVDEVRDRITKREEDMNSGRLNGLQYVEALLDNNDDIEKLGIEVFGNNAKLNGELKELVPVLREIIEKSDGNNAMFNTLMEQTFGKAEL